MTNGKKAGLARAWCSNRCGNRCVLADCPQMNLPGRMARSPGESVSEPVAPALPEGGLGNHRRGRERQRQQRLPMRMNLPLRRKPPKSPRPTLSLPRRYPLRMSETAETSAPQNPPTAIVPTFDTFLIETDGSALGCGPRRRRRRNFDFGRRGRSGANRRRWAGGLCRPVPAGPVGHAAPVVAVATLPDGTSPCVGRNRSRSRRLSAPGRGIRLPRRKRPPPMTRRQSAPVALLLSETGAEVLQAAKPETALRRVLHIPSRLTPSPMRRTVRCSFLAWPPPIPPCASIWTTAR